MSSARTIEVPVTLGHDPDAGTALLIALERLLPDCGSTVVQNVRTGSGTVTVASSSATVNEVAAIVATAVADAEL